MNRLLSCFASSLVISICGGSLTAPSAWADSEPKRLICQVSYALDEDLGGVIRTIGDPIELDLTEGKAGKLPIYCNGYRKPREFRGDIGIMIYFSQSPGGEALVSSEIYYGRKTRGHFHHLKDARLRDIPADTRHWTVGFGSNDREDVRGAWLECRIEGGPPSRPFEMIYCPHEKRR